MLSCEPEQAYSEDGVDLTLIRWMLSLSRAERLAVLEDFIDFRVGGACPKSRDLRSAAILPEFMPGQAQRDAVFRRHTGRLRMAHTGEMELSAGLHVRVLNLETLIAVKEEIAGEKDLAVLPVMRRMLEEKQRR